MRLIDADRLKDEFREDTEIGLALRTLADLQPTAYDIDKVVEELEENQTITFKLGGGKPIQTIDLENAIEIVKAGGKND